MLTRIDAINLSNYDTNLRFYTNAAGSTTQVERMRIDSSGLVRIQKNTASTTEPLLKLSNANGSTTDGVKMIFEVANTSGNGGEIAVVRDGGSFNPYMTFNVSSGVASAPTERMRIDSSGNVNIYGTDNRPLAITSFDTVSAGAGWDLDATSGNGVITMSTGGTERMRITPDGGSSFADDKSRTRNK